MRLISVSSLLGNEVLAKAIYNDSGQILLGADVVLSANLIERLQNKGIPYVYIKDPRTKDIEVNDIVSEITKRESLKKVSETMNKIFSDQKTKSKIAAPTLAKDFNKLFDNIIYDLQKNKEVMLHLVNINQKDDYLYHHSVNVGILSAAIGVAMGYNMNEVRELGIGAMLHDIGKTKIPLEILNKPGKLSDEEFIIMKTHSEEGYLILKEQPGISLIMAHVAFQHHERYNGSGYPRAIAGDEVHKYAKIVAVADVYDALTSNRVYRKASLPHEAFELIMGSGDYHFDHKVVKKFTEIVAIYPIGMTVRLNTGEVGVVTAVEPAYPQRPTIRILTDSSGKDISIPYTLNLLEHNTLVIAATAADI